MDRDPAGAATLATLYLWLLTRTTTLVEFRHNISSEPLYMLSVVYFAPIFLALFSFNVGTLITMRRTFPTSVAATALSVGIGSIGVGCPVYGALALSLLGITAGLASLPLGGFEVWLTATIIMTLTLRATLRRITTSRNSARCTIPPTSDRRIPAIMLVTLAFSSPPSSH